SWARFCNWVRPYLPAPSIIEWQGNGGSDGGAGPAAGAAGSTPPPLTRAPSALPLAHAPQMARACGPGAFALGDRSWALGRGGPPAGPVQQPAPGRRRTVGSLPVLDVVDLQQEVGILGGLGAEVEHRRVPDQLGEWGLGHVLAVPTGHPVHRRVEVGARVLA